MKNWLKDTAERAVASFLEAFLAIVIVSGTVDWSPDNGKKALLAGAAAALTVLKAAIANVRPGTISPASAVKPAAPPEG